MLRHCHPSGRIVVALIQTQILGILRRGLGPLRHHRIQRRIQQLGSVAIGPIHHRGQGSTVPFHQQTGLDAVLAPIGGIGANGVPPDRDLRKKPSAACHAQSTPPSSSQWCWTTPQMRLTTPAFTHRWKKRWTVLSSPNSRGRWSHWRPVRIRKMMASRMGRGALRGCLVVLGGSSSSKIGATKAHNSSGTRQIVGIASGFQLCGFPIGSPAA